MMPPPPTPATDAGSGWIRSRVRALYTVGVELVPPEERKRVQVTNLLAWLGLVVTSAYSLVYLLALGSWTACLVNASTMVGYLFALHASRRGRTNAARFAISAAFLVDMALVVLVLFSRETGLHRYLIVGGPIAFFLFDARQARWRAAVTILSLVLYGLCEAVPSLELVGGLSPAVCRVTDVSTVFVVVGLILIIESAFLHEIEEREAALDVAAHIDALTRLPNRSSTLELAQVRISAAGRGQALAVMMLDLDHFKIINDTHGHPTGDHVLGEVAGVLRSLLRPGDLVGRVGGEEFLVVAESPDAARAMGLAERLRAGVAASRVTSAQGVELQPTVSIGVAMLWSDEATLDVLISRADTALYSAKRAGRNRCVMAGAGVSLVRESS